MNHNQTTIAILRLDVAKVIAPEIVKIARVPGNETDDRPWAEYVASLTMLVVDSILKESGLMKPVPMKETGT